MQRKGKKDIKCPRLWDMESDHDRKVEDGLERGKEWAVLALEYQL